jgi:hypothetical protein
MPQLPSRAKANWYVFPELSIITISNSCFRIFTEEEVKLARARMPSEVKPFTGLFKWKDIRRWHTTWHPYLCKSTDHQLYSSIANESKFPCSLPSWLSLVNLEDLVSTQSTTYTIEMLRS